MRPPAANPLSVLDWPLTFERVEEWDDSLARFVFRGSHYTLYLEDRASLLILAANPLSRDKGDGDGEGEGEGSAVALRMTLVGANPESAPVGVGDVSAAVHHFIGNDPAVWRTEVPVHTRVVYSAVYPGIDWIIHGDARRPKFDFDLAPGADHRRIVMDFEGAMGVTIDDEGHLRVRTEGGTVRKERPLIYQENEGRRDEIDGGYVLLGEGRVGFRVGDHDRSRRLVIDPVIVYSTYVGGMGSHSLAGVAVDPQGNVVVAGRSQVFGSIPPHNQETRVLVAKFNPSGNLVYITFIGGTTAIKPLPTVTPALEQNGTCVALDADGNAYVGGSTNAKDFPLVNALQSTAAGATGFVFKLDPEGRGPIFSTYLGGNTGLSGIAGPVLLQDVRAIALDAFQNVYLTGRTNTTDFPVTPNAFQHALKGTADNVFVTKLSPAGNSLLYSTYLGGKSSDVGEAIAVDADGNAYIAGQANSMEFPTTPHAFQPARRGSFDVFVTKLSPAGDALVFSTFLGGTNAQVATGIAIDPQRNVYVTGWTASQDFPVVNSFQTFPGTDDYPFVSKLSADGGQLIYSTRLGEGIGSQIAVDDSGHAYATGSAGSTFPLVPPDQPPKLGSNVYVTKFNPDGTSLNFSLMLGGSDTSFLEGTSIMVRQAIAVGADGRVYVAGSTKSTDFPVLHGVQPINVADPGKTCGFLTVIGEPGVLSFSDLAYSAAATDTSAHVTVNRTSGTALAVAVNFVVSAGTAMAGVDFVAATGTLNFAVGQASAAFNVALLGNPNAATDRTVSLTLSGPTGGASLGMISAATLVLRAAPSVIQFQDSSTTVQFDVGNTTVAVLRSGNLAGSATAAWKTSAVASPGAVVAVPGVDYVESSGTVTFTANQSEQDVTVTILNGGGAGNRQFSVILKSATGAAILGSNTTTIIAINHPS